jgi:hypothetical protein
MKKTILAVLATLITATAWAKAPAIVGTIANRANGHIVLTSNPCPSDKEKLFAYVKEEGGRISVTGCWAWQDPKIFVFWQIGDVYEYDFSSVELSPEFIEYLKRNQSNGSEI